MRPVLTPIFELNFQQRLHISSMTGDFTNCTVKVPLVNDSHPKFNVSVNYPSKGTEQLLINLTCHFGQLNCIHSEEIDLLMLKQVNDIPGSFPAHQPL